MADVRSELAEVRTQLGDRETDIRRLRSDVDRLQRSLKAAVGGATCFRCFSIPFLCVSVRSHTTK